MESCLRKLELIKEQGCGFVFHFDGQPLNYSTIQSNYRGAFRKAGLPYNSQTHCMRHGAATLARKLGGGLDAAIAITGHKDLKLADHYSKIDEDFQRDVFHKVSNHVSDLIFKKNQPENVVSISKKSSKSKELAVLNGSKK
jgi:integrase